MAFGRTTRVLEECVSIDSYAIVRKHDEQHCIKRLVAGTPVDRYGDLDDNRLQRSISIGFDRFREI